MHSMCGADAGCLAINYQSLLGFGFGRDFFLLLLPSFLAGPLPQLHEGSCGAVVTINPNPLVTLNPEP